jgi:hypothetical protein
MVVLLLFFDRMNGGREGIYVREGCSFREEGSGPCQEYEQG